MAVRLQMAQRRFKARKDLKAKREFRSRLTVVAVFAQARARRFLCAKRVRRELAILRADQYVVVLVVLVVLAVLDSAVARSQRGL
jgi:hypothetical protein